MQSWSRPTVPRLPGTGVFPRIFDSATQSLVEASPYPATPGIASIYVCGITPYDATHLGHAATYLAFDTLIRVWLDAGLEVRYVQNTTDIDDPLLERAARDSVDWRELAASQIELFRGDMENLCIIPPDEYVAVTDVVPDVADAVKVLLQNGSAYHVPSAGAADDVYFDSGFAATAWHLGQESSLDRATMLALSAERGGDPLRAGKRDPLDPLLWRSERIGEPAWESALGRGRPGWHIECSVIALAHLPTPLTVNGGGRDLVFPHHEFSAGHAAALTGHPLARIYAHAGMVAHEGEKMSKSLGNLVLVSRLVAGGADPRAIRLALLSERYRNDWEWTDAHLRSAEQRLISWMGWAATTAIEGEVKGASGDSASGDSALVEGGVVSGGASGGASGDGALLTELRERLADDLDTPGAIAAFDAHIRSGAAATQTAIDALDALLGIRLAP
ncbi:cysteine--1-D-myo-inosityl 2-amino-2-deoxy-alpha-D-glucopyranoside ligase [Frigoribacterium sp. CG_9.8]|uniref:cysteine--1-D-myo-inosityl 2-amino-2-deoxy-alpha-D-glucopyranoside ligase n=1 Tax=Frigoribacterium sp. CG_9.8 TaxID=2787733 RepID=UPI0018CA76F4|nr:L-cysteine:1D-myo-inositol 2-amino-2-deoxy-alpha-D-glucopyranoside ligase [Frigoribacterium sp. CG_9.8]